MNAPWQIEMLGELRSTHADRVLSRFRARKTGILLAYLAFYPRPHPREELVELLWPECVPKAGRQNLRVELGSLRKQLEPPEIPHGAVIQADHRTIGLNPLAYQTDVARFETAFQTAAKTRSDSERVPRLIEAAELYRGELLPGYFEEWIIAERLRLAEAFHQALAELIGLLEQAGDLAQALRWARRAVTADPLREESQQTLIRLFVENGQGKAARRQYAELERLLAEQLGATPSPEIWDLVARGQHGDAGVAEERPGKGDKGHGVLTASPDHPASLPSESRLSTTKDDPPSEATLAAASRPLTARLPLQFTRFFGREREIAQLQALLLGELGAGSEQREPGPGRLVTLTGPGGSGKTRLGLAVAQRLREPLHDAVWFVPLQDLVDPQAIVEKVLDALQAPRSPNVEPLEQVVACLSQQPSLLLLDNLEHLVAEGAGLVRTLLERVETLTILVTSRQRLNLAGEQEFPVPPLPVPADDSLLGVDRVDQPALADPSTLNPQLSTLAQYASVRLIVDRAQAAKPDFQLTLGNAAAVATLCRQLEGLPLAIELAAARVGVLTPAQMLERLSQRFELLVGRQRDGDARHRSLWATLDWSYQLLEPELQRFFARLSVFRGGWTLEAAEAITCREARLPTQWVDACEEPQALEHLQQLRECSLVLAEEIAVGNQQMADGSSVPPAPRPTVAEMRYWMLETLREYGTEQLGPEERADLARRHAAFFMALAEGTKRTIPPTPVEQKVWRDQMERELGNLRAALEWSLSIPDSGQMGLKLAGALCAFWENRNYFSEGRRWLQRLLARSAGTPSSSGDPRVLEARAKALTAAALLALYQGDFDQARSLQEECLTLALAAGCKENIANCHWHLGLLAREQADYEQARFYYERCLLLHEELDCEPALILNDLGYVAYLQGDCQAARPLLKRSLVISRQTECQHVATWTVTHLGEVADALGEYQVARALLEESLAAWREMDFTYGLAWALQKLGRVACHERGWDTARSCLTEALTLRQKIGDRRGIAEDLEGFAGVAVGQGQHEQAAPLFGAAAALREAVRSPLPPVLRAEHEQLVAAARTALGEPTFASAWAKGRGTPVEEAIAFALEENTGG
jgi:predicted ATPase/DNA-binding SARP family transcriptional activator